MKSSKHLQQVHEPMSLLESLSETKSIASMSSLNSNSINSNITNNTRIIELEYQLKMKENDIQNIINEYNLKLQMKDLEIKHKDDIIEMLRNKPQLIIQEKEIVNEIVEITKPKLPVKECLEKYLKNAPTIETCKSKLFKEDYNSYITEIDIEDKPINILSITNFKISDFNNSGINNAVSIIKNLFKQFDTNELPFYCSDKKRNILYIKTNDGWIKETKQNAEEFDKLLLELAKNALCSVNYAVGNTELIFKKSRKSFLEIYGKNETDWIVKNKMELFNVLSLNGSNDTKYGDGDETKENKRLVVKKLKNELADMSKSFSDCESE
jgi:hypothetical protein